MRTRILFVDDEPLTLQGLQRMLRGSRNLWEMAFAASGAEALDRMSQHPFDIIVSDMLMPGMNGTELLNEVRQRHPATVRFVLSGHAERRLVLRSAVAAHQYLAKPCNPDALKNRLNRTERLFQWIEGNDLLRQKITGMDRFPIVPRLYAEFANHLQEPEIQFGRIQEIISQDIGLCAFMLKLTNSAFFGTSRSSANATEAAALIGPETIKALVFSENAFSPFEGPALQDQEIEKLWKHSLAVAHASRQIAELEEAEPEAVQCAFAAGLLHDAGKFLLMFHNKDPYAQAQAIAKERGVSSWIAEREVMRISHTEAAAYLFGLWGLPSDVVNAIAWHHTPAQSGLNQMSPVTAVHAGNALIHRRTAGVQSPEAEIDFDHLRALGLEKRLSAWADAVDEMTLGLHVCE